MLGLSLAGLFGSLLSLSFIQDAHNVFLVLGGFFVERASHLRHRQPPIAEAEKGAPSNRRRRLDGTIHHIVAAGLLSGALGCRSTGQGRQPKGRRKTGGAPNLDGSHTPGGKREIPNQIFRGDLGGW